MNGHPNSYHYFLIIKASDEDKLNMVNEALLESYLDGAPAGHAYLQGEEYHKYHYGWSSSKTKAGGHASSLSQLTNEGAIMRG